MRAAVRNTEIWKGRRAPTQDPSTHNAPRSGDTCGVCGIDDARFDNPLLLTNSTGDYTGAAAAASGNSYFMTTV